MACEIPQLIEMIILEQKELLETFWQFLDRPNNNDNSSGDSVDPSLESLLASYFAKTITIFLTKQPAEVSQRGAETTGDT
jgi:serine/threonine-protein phosphatase 6 regulatory subunit 3